MKKVMNLKKALLDSLPEEREHDSRFRSWAKRVKAVDMTKSNGYAFIGDFVQSGTVEAEPGIYLVCSVNGSRKYPTQRYSVLRLDDEFNIEILPPYTTDTVSGWALRLRDEVAALLGQRPDNPLVAFSDEDLLAEVRRRGLI